MSIRSYNELYVESVADNLGTMLTYVSNCGIDIINFWNRFVCSKVAKEIERGNPKYLVGLSAEELLYIIIEESKEREKLKNIVPFFDRNKYYWTGYVLAYYQNYKCISFETINKRFPVDKIISLYNPLHEADITKFYSVADEYVNKKEEVTNLKKFRSIAGLSQSELAKEAEVSIRNIQMYEQRKNDINKAQVDILFRLYKVLGCRIEDLLEE